MPDASGVRHSLTYLSFNPEPTATAHFPRRWLGVKRIMDLSCVVRRSLTYLLRNTGLVTTPFTSERNP
jgi:hypothetical protein